MRSLFYLLSSLAVIGLAVWAYRENYETQKVASQAQSLQREIGEARARLAVLKAEWAYQNRPDRLRQLAEINFTDLGLLPLRPDQFGKVDQVAFPVKDLLFNAPIEVSSDGASQ
ncbi:cell division protein FtsL [Pseudooceanicola sp. 216_PA32_1]|uniref:Cell division protein FtsL n=1 Tax=Pseudooceanicola pacificus TaxID=2676438 RepID=A0A844WCC6_9RHOB|nr:cell division protein FtsL [Pseudooceanicola pacificus]MWB78638.1 cell division protein FtsL [Pseudooceanicola pacificus]